ncbi:hypothetical protein LJK88_49935 [Paenibacillus sp. P26]|nr:hypothetical protein LJK88_49935 [Paenibacillus sp. P26]UUZ91449.1 hypothetical protein LJK87_38395 [Paenibacillus sp. P25]
MKHEHRRPGGDPHLGDSFGEHEGHGRPPGRHGGRRDHDHGHGHGHDNGHGRGHGHGRHGHDGGPHPGSAEFGRSFQSAQTFRRRRALAFLERLYLMRSTLQRQLNEPEFESIRPVISGELKAVDSVIQEFIYAFELREAPQTAADLPSPDSGGSE